MKFNQFFRYLNFIYKLNFNGVTMYLVVRNLDLERHNQIIDLIKGYGFVITIIEKAEHGKNVYFRIPPFYEFIELYTKKGYGLMNELMTLMKDLGIKFDIHLVPKEQAQNKPMIFSYQGEDFDFYVILPRGIKYSFGDSIELEAHFRNKLEVPFNAMLESGYLIHIRIEDISGDTLVELAPTERKMTELTIQPNEEYVEKINFDTDVFNTRGVYNLIVRTTFMKMEDREVFYQIEPIEIRIV